MNHISILWNQESYSFCVKKELSNPNNHEKSVWLGHFVERAPANLSPNTLYVLKKILVPTTSGSVVPQAREYYDLLSLEGNHLREILAADSTAGAIQTQICGNQPISTDAKYAYIVEPQYESTDSLFAKCQDLSVWERLEVIRQYALGIQELTHQKQPFPQIDAHRDLKPENGVLEKISSKEFRIRLIDFASIRTTDPAGTYRGPLSPSNTAPENLMENFRVGPKTDLYALGMMLASLFVTASNTMHAAPSLCLANILPRDPIEFGIQLKAVFQDCLNKGDDQENTSWIETYLKKQSVPFQWDFPDSSVIKKIHSLFVDATHIDPDHRITLADFIWRIEALQEECRSSAGHSKLLYLPKKAIAAALFSSDQFSTYQISYQQAAQSLFADGTALVCMSYAEQQISDPVICTDAQQLNSFLNATPTASVPCGAFLLALYRLLKFLEQEKDTLAFDGNLHLFLPNMCKTENLPTLDGAAEGELSWDRLLSLFFTQHLCSQYPTVFLHSPEGSASEVWYELVPLPASESFRWHFTGSKEHPPKPHRPYTVIDGITYYSTI